MRSRNVIWFCCFTLSLSLLAPSLLAEESIAANVLVLGQIENVESQSLFVVSREVGVAAPRDLVSVHELTQVTKNDDGTMTRSYRQEPCVIFVDENHDHVLTANERRWKQPNDHVCPIALLPGYLTLAIDDAAKTVRLDWHLPRPNRQTAAEVRNLEARNQIPFIERHTQLPDMDD
jgi:hypothetical protein